MERSRSPTASDLVCCDDPVSNQIRGYRKRLMMGRLAISHGALGDLPNHCRVGVGKSYLRQRGRQSHAVTEAEHILHFVGGASFHSQLHYQTERHLLTVKELMGRRSHRQAVVHRMCDSK